MSTTLVLSFHPDLASSRANSALLKAARAMDGAEIVDVSALYPDGVIDDAAETARLLAAERIVLQFPVQWYSTPALLKAWQDAVLTRMFYIRPGEGALLKGKGVMVAATFGNTADSYGPSGSNRYSPHELLLPLRASANRCGLEWAPPFYLFDAREVSERDLAEAVARYEDRLCVWSAEQRAGAARRLRGWFTGAAGREAHS